MPSKYLEPSSRAYEAKRQGAQHRAPVRRKVDIALHELELPTRGRAVEETQEANESQIANDGPAIFANYYDGAHDRVSAAEPVVSLRKLAP